MVAPPSLQRVTVADAVTRYVTSFERAVVTGSLARTTAENYSRDLREFVELAGAERVLDDLSADDLDEVMVGYGSRPDGRYRNAAGKTRGIGATKRFKQSVSGLFRHATRAGWVQHNPVPDMQVTLRGQRTRSDARTALPQSSADALLDVPALLAQRAAGGDAGRADQDMSARDQFLLYVLLEVGPRVSEVCAADRADITTDDSGVGWLHIRNGKGGKERRVSLSPATMDALVQYDEARPEPKARTREVDGQTVVTAPAEDAERALLLTWRGLRMRPRDVQNRLHRLVSLMPAEVRRDVTPHGLRHTAATLLLRSGAADVATVRDILGHGSVSTTSIYLDGDAAAMVAAVRSHPVTMAPQARRTAG